MQEAGGTSSPSSAWTDEYTYLALLGRGTHTLELAYVDPATGRLGAVRTATLTVT